MEEARRRLGLRAVLGVVAVVVVAAVFWAASAVAAGGSPSSERGTNDPSNTPAAANVQNESEAPDLISPAVLLAEAAVKFAIEAST